MLSLTVYKLLHLIGLFGLFLSIGSAIAATYATGEQPALRKFSAMTHGISLLIVLVGGFGMLARLGVHWPWPKWILLKLGIWVTFGVLPVLIKKRLLLPSVALLVSLLLGGLAGYAAFWKPFSAALAY